MNSKLKINDGREWYINMEKLLDLLPIIVGALIAVVPTLVDKYFDKRNHKETEERAKKQALYIELIELIGKVLTGLKAEKKSTEFGENIDDLRCKINLISVVGSVEVVRALNSYIDTWGNVVGNNQTVRYTELLRAIRVDLKIDKSRNPDFPEVGLKDINLK